MIRPLTPVDLLRFLFLNEPEKTNRALTIDGLLNRRGANFSIIGAARSSLPLNGELHAWASSSRNGNPNGFIIAKRMSRRLSWNITHLVLRQKGEQYLSHLLEKIAQTAGACDAQSVFLRLAREDVLVDVAKHSGYFPRVPETLFVRSSALGGMDFRERSGISRFQLTPRLQSDDHSLFRLYNAATPAEIRYAVGMTIDQWLASHEVTRGRHEEYVLRDGEAIIGWLGIVRRSNKGHVSAMIHPEHEQRTQEIVDFGLNRLEGVREVYSLVPEYQIAVQTALAEKGFKPSLDYVTLIKTMTIKEKEQAHIRVVASTGL